MPDTFKKTTEFPMLNLKIDDTSFALKDLLGVQVLETGHDIATLARRFVVLQRLCEKRGAIPGNQQVNDTLDEWRAECEFENVAELRSWCRENGVTDDAIKMFAVSMAMEQSLIESISDSEIDTRRADELDTSQLRDVYAMYLASRSEADEYLQVLEKDPTRFMALAREKSIEPQSRVQGGYVGRMTKDELPKQLAESLFAIDDGDVVGPVDADDAVVLCTSHRVPEGDDVEDDAELFDEILEEWIEREIFNRVVQRPYLES